MSDQYLGEIRLFAFPRIPTGWVLCDGRPLSIQENEALYALIGDTYGSVPPNAFRVPDLRGRVPIHKGTSNQGNTYAIGQVGGEEQHVLIVAEMAAHSHGLVSTSNAGTTATPASNVHLATSSIATKNLYAPPAKITGYSEMADCVSNDGKGQPHENMMPTLIMSFCIANEGVFPSG